MRGLKKGISAVIAATLFLTALPVKGIEQVQAAGRDATGQESDVVVSMQPENASKFNDTNGDGYGEFEGWGTSLCWWANRLGYSEELTRQAADVFFSENGLNMNIGRYNVGGGDNVYESGNTEITPNEKAVVYGVEGERAPQYGGSEMKVEDYTKLGNATYTVSDADFGFAEGSKVGNFKQIGWVNGLGDENGQGGNLNFNVNATDAGKYTIKMLWSLEGENKRAVAIRVNAETDYVVSAEEVNNNMIITGSGNNSKLFLVTFQDVELKAGDNTLAIGGSAANSTDGKESWAPNFVKMLVIKAGDEGVLPDDNENPGEGDFAHPTHITRSDSAVPGYCVDVTKITEGMDKTKFARVDEECGYAWNYDWDADKNQMNILKAAIEANDGFLAEAFSNSPPYFMTKSGCSSGATNSSEGNLREDSYHAFAAYMADVMEHWAENGINWQSVSPMNEPNPAAGYWGANSNKQEGCHIEVGENQSKVITTLNEELQRKAAAATDPKVKEILSNVVYAGTDETSIDWAISSYNALDSKTKQTVTRIDTHAYSGSKRDELRTLAEQENKNLWMSEVDGAYTAGTNAGEMTGALGLAGQIMKDLNGMKATAWILWNAVDNNADAENGPEKWPFGNDYVDMEKLFQKVDLNKGYWGIAFGDHNNQQIVLSKKYEAFGQFSRYIRPGYTIIGSDNSNTLAAWDTQGKKLVVVAMNTQAEDQRWKFDLRKFTGINSANFSKVSAYRTSGSMENGEKWADVSASVNAASDASSKTFAADMKANSITTFIIEGVESYNADQDYETAEQKVCDKMWDDVFVENDKIIEQNQDKIEKIDLNADMVTGSAPWNNGTTDIPQNVVDGNLNTFFDGVTNGWVQIDLGREEHIAAAAYAPRSGFASRCVGASFYGSKDGNNWTLLYTITETPAQGQLTRVNASRFKAPNEKFRYIQYAVPKGDSSANCNVAEIELYRMNGGVTFNEPDFPENIQEWVAYYKKATNGKTYSAASKKVFDAAMKKAEDVLSSTDSGKQAEARKALAEAYLALEPIFTYDSFSGVNGAEIRDNNGKVIQAHGGQIQQLTVNGKTKWYWIGEDKTNDYRPCPGIHMYTSEDLYNWTDEGVVLKTAKTYEEFNTDKYFTDLYGDLKTEEEKKAIFTDIWQGENADEGCVIERPKMLYNEKTKKYVIWFHADGQDPFAESSGGNYAKAKAGVAISDSPTGPYKLLGSYLLNFNEDANHGFDSEGGHVRDMNLFKDDDGTAYVMYSSDGNQTMHIARLNDEYTNVAKPQGEAVEGVDFTRNFINISREAPAMFKYNNKYYMITSGCTGWSPNQANYAVADHPLGPWTTMGDPCAGNPGSGTTYDTQSTCVFPVDAANGKFIYMGDRWSNPDQGKALRDSRYVWLPVEFLADNKISLKRAADWTLEDEVFQRKSDKTKLYKNITKAGMLKEADYTEETWKAFYGPFQEAMEVQDNQDADQATVDQANTSLEAALKQLKTLQAFIKDYLTQGINKNLIPDSKKDYYTAESWKVYKTVLKEAQALLKKQDVTREEAEDAIKALADAKSVLEDSTIQVISYTKKYTKALGDKAFKLDAKRKVGNGKLSYKSSNKKVAVVDGNGKVTIKGIGVSTITVTAAKTSKYDKKSVNITLTVNPKKAAISKLTPVQGKKLKVTWKKVAKADGYVVQYAKDKKFKNVVGKVTVKKAGTTSTTITKKLTKGKKYYVRVRAYKTVEVNGKNKKLSGDWSKVKLSGKIK